MFGVSIKSMLYILGSKHMLHGAFIGQNLLFHIFRTLIKTIPSSFPPFPDNDRVTESFDKLNNTDVKM